MTHQKSVAQTGAMPAIAPQVRIGHVHLKVADIERSLVFYCEALGFSLKGRIGHEAAFLSAGSYHHHLAINTWHSRDGLPPSRDTTGLDHVAFLYPDRAALCDALWRLRAANIQIDGASDHGVGEAIYLRDPDGNGIELYWDRPEADWPRNPDGSIKLMALPWDLTNWLAKRSA